jgi:transposase
MTSVPAGTNIWIAAGVTDLRRGFPGLSAVAQTALEQDPYSGHVFVFRGRRGDLIKLLWNGDGLCLFAKRLERSFCLAESRKGLGIVDPRTAVDVIRALSENPTEGPF